MNQLLNGKQKSTTKSGNYEAKNSQSAMGFHKNDLSLPDLGDISDLKSLYFLQLVGFSLFSCLKILEVEDVKD